MFSKFFIDRPRFAMVIAVVLAIAGGIAAFNMPITQYPDVTPPQINVMASYPGASAEVMAKTVGAPLEEVINGVEGMIYMNSRSSNAGTYSLSITFATGTDTDMALVKVQNRIQQATPILPAEVNARGVMAYTSFSDTLGFIGLMSPNGTRDELFLTDYAYNNIRNVLKRIPGMGDAQVFGAKYSVRVWLDPERIASFGLAINDVAAAISSQNKQASIGSIGASPGNDNQVLTYSLSAIGRLTSIRDFENIIVRTNEQGGMVLLRDVARVELGADSYALHAGFQGQPAAVIALSQAAGSNALTLMSETKKALKELEKDLPADTEFIIGYDATDYVKETIFEIMMTLLLTFSLVVFVCYIFLQDWRVALVPVAAIPISLLATFTGLRILGYSINILTLFGLVLVIGTVVDDAIIVVERMLFVMDRDKCSAREATVTAMRDVTGPMTATTLVFLAIFVPVAFAGSITGQIYRQFAVTISFSVIFSLVVALTLSPAMCAHMLEDVKPKTKGPLAWFNKIIDASTKHYVAGSVWIARRTIVTLGLLLVVVALSFGVLKFSPRTFIPDEDQGALFATIQLPEGATQARTKAVLNEMIPQVKDIPGVKYVVNIEGFDIAGSQGENVASIIIALDHWALRKTSDKGLRSIMGKVSKIGASINAAQVNVFAPPAIMGLGITGGIDMRLQSTMEDDPVKLAMVTQQMLGKIFASPEFMYAFTAYTADTPHLFVDVDREKAEVLKVPISSIFSTLQTYFGSIYINDINIGTQVNKVLVQADAAYRRDIANIGSIYVRALDGKQIPLESVVTVRKILAPRSISRYNMFPSSALTVLMKPGFSTGQGMQKLEALAAELPEGYSYEWSGMTYQEQRSTGQIILLIGIALLFGYLFLVAQYESWMVPIPVILSLPVALLGALSGLFILRLPISIYSQLGVLLLVGLAAKNAILIIEFAKEQHEDHGLPILQSAAVAANERFRAVIMTAFTCVFGVSPMLFASGAGAASRAAVGTTMFFGMSAATILGIFLIPGLYVFFQRLREKLKMQLGRFFLNKED